MSNSHFDRLAGLRRNRRLRNICAGVAGGCFMLAVILWLDPMVSGSAPNDGWALGFVALFLIFAAAALYFHMRFLTRE
ncbi:hypothetical protein KKH27_10640 [bacterium]|nr:hypothetical protein [bacterium]MBU1984086.1 hypothetical protein [bacterium]